MGSRYGLIRQRHLVPARSHSRLQTRNDLAAVSDDIAGVRHIQCNHRRLVPSALRVQRGGLFLGVADAPCLFAVAELKPSADNRLIVSAHSFGGGQGWCSIVASNVGPAMLSSCGVCAVFPGSLQTENRLVVAGAERPALVLLH